jgi:branched-chain amino acid transport system ATP-binding protein
MANEIAIGAAAPGCKKVDPILVADNVIRQFGGLRFLAAKLPP